MKKIAALFALAALLLIPTASRAADQRIAWTILASTTWETNTNATPCALSFQQYGIMTGTPFSGAFVDRTCFDGVQLDSPTHPMLGYKGFWMARSTDGTQTIWGWYEFTAPTPNIGQVVNGTGTFTITGGVLPAVQCPALVCPFPDKIGGGGTVHVIIPLASAAYLIFDGNLHYETA